MIPYFYFSVIQTSFKSLDCFMIYSEAYFNKGIDGQNNVLLNHMKKILMEVKWFKTKINSLEVKLHNMQHSYI